MNTYTPTVLVVDDDPAFIRYVRREFHNNTTVGVLVARDLREGRALAENTSATVDALLTDLYFDEGKDLPAEGLFDGIDFAAAVKLVRPTLPTYFLSYFSDDPALHDKAKRSGVNPLRWLPKMWVPAGQRKATNDAPWNLVELDLMHIQIGQATEQFAGLQEHSITPINAASVAVKVRRPHRTYIQTLPDPKLRLTRPIEVICTIDEEMARAVAPALGLLEEGYGESVEEALDALANIVKNQYESLTGPDVVPTDYANAVKDRIMSFVTRD